MLYKKLLISGIIYALSAFTFVACGGGGGGGAVATGGTDPVPDPEPYEAVVPTAEDSHEGGGDDSLVTASGIVVGALQARSIYPAGDRDWVAVSLTQGVAYEIFATNLNETGDTQLTLYNAGGSKLNDGTAPFDTADDYVAVYGDSNIKKYIPTYTGTHYIEVSSFDDPYGVASYQLGVRQYVDADHDGFGLFYDCDDSDLAINPWEYDISGNGIDENCDGVDPQADTTADSYEDDGTRATAQPMPITEGSMEEYQYRSDVVLQMRTINAAGDVDFLLLTLPPNVGGYIIDNGMNSLEWWGNYSWELQDENGTLLASDTVAPWEWVDNTTASPLILYLKVFATNGTSTGGYAPAFVSYSEDQDVDTFYTKGDVVDCDDTDAAVYPGAADPIDGVDQDCDGIDG